MNTPFKTSDVYLAAYLKTSGFIPSLELQPGAEIIFSFAASDKLDASILEYNNDHPVKAQTYASAAKYLRGKLLSMKHSVPRG